LPQVSSNEDFMNISPLLDRRVQGRKPPPIRKLVPIVRMPGMLAPEQVEEDMARFAKRIERERERINKRTGF